MKIRNTLTFKMALPAIIIIALGVWFTLEKVEHDARKEAGALLQSTLQTTQQAVRSWVNVSISDAQLFANMKGIQEHTLALLEIPNTNEALLSSPSQTYLRSWFLPVAASKGFKGFFIVDSESTSLASSRDQNVGTVNLLVKQPGFLDDVWAGKTVISLPQFSDVPLNNEDKKNKNFTPTMFIGSPIYDASGEIMAAFLLRIDPFANFTALFKSARIGKTGETYAFNKQGRLISESRFDDHLRQIGLIPVENRSILNISIRNPGVNLVRGEKSEKPRDQQPLTFMTKSATSGKAGMNLEGYRDYRGVPVVGTWLWDSELGFGIATEINIGEVSQFQSTIRIIVILFTTLSVLALITLGILFEKNRAHAHAAKIKAQALDRAKTLFLATVSHELRTPLTAIIGFSDMLVGQHFGSLGSDKNKEYAKVIYTSGTRLLGLISKILEIVAIEVGERSLNKEQLFLENVITESYSTTIDQARDKDIRYTIKTQENQSPIYADVQILKQILDNLLSNAIKSTPEGGEVMIKVSDENGYSSIEITDTGEGISADQISTIINPFTKDNMDFDTAKDGIDLELSIASSLTDLHGGKLSIKSTIDKGTTVTIKLPNNELKKPT